jgi:general secretion pathway protein L
MAAQVLKRGEVVVWLPPRSDGERAFGTEANLLASTPAGAGRTPQPRDDATPGASRDGLRCAPASLEALASTRQVRLVFDPRDVTLIPAEVPLLGGARLAQALPNIVEDALLQDPATCAFVAGPLLEDGRRMVAVIDRAWLEFTVGAFERRGIRVRSATPAQLALPWSPGTWSLGCMHGGLALRSGEHTGLGWTAGTDPDFRVEAIVALIETAAGDGPRPQGIVAYLEDDSWGEPLQRATDRLEIDLQMGGLPAPESTALDLLGGRVGAGRRMMATFDPRAWRLPVALAAGCVAVSLIGLNLHWAQMAREKRDIRDAMEQTFRDTFPGAQVVVDPVLQMTRQVAVLRARSGQTGPEDFVPLLAKFSQAIGAQANDALAGVEFREGRLRVRFQPQLVDGQAAREQLRQACARAGLRLQFDNEREPMATVGLQT